MQKNCAKTNSGFTLIEMMMVVALIAILAVIALPAYNGYVNRSKIKTVQADLVALSLNFENRYQRTLSYPASDYADTAAIRTAFSNWAPASKASDFTFSTTGSTSSSYTLVATGAGGGVSGCVISITSGGVRAIATCPYSSDGNWL
jgi:type IV pilus assembly protein PilE